MTAIRIFTLTLAVLVLSAAQEDTKAPDRQGFFGDGQQEGELILTSAPTPETTGWFDGVVDWIFEGLTDTNDNNVGQEPTDTLAEEPEETEEPVVSTPEPTPAPTTETVGWVDGMLNWILGDDTDAEGPEEPTPEPTDERTEQPVEPAPEPTDEPASVVEESEPADEQPVEPIPEPTDEPASLVEESEPADAQDTDTSGFYTYNPIVSFDYEPPKATSPTSACIRVNATAAAKNNNNLNGKFLILGDCDDYALTGDDGWRHDTTTGLMHYQLNDNLCMQAGAGNTSKEGNTLRLATCNAAQQRNQQWQFGPDGLRPVQPERLCAVWKGMQPDPGVDPIMLTRCNWVTDRLVWEFGAQEEGGVAVARSP